MTGLQFFRKCLKNCDIPQVVHLRINDPPRAMPEIILLGATFDTGNMGVSALACSLVKLFSDMDPEARIGFFVGAKSRSSHAVRLADRVVNVGIINYRMSPRARLGEHLLWIFLLSIIQRYLPFVRARIIGSNSALRAIANAEVVGDIRGGDSFSDIYGVRGFVMGSLPSIIALLLGKRLILFPQTYGPYSSKTPRFLARWILSRAGRILLRDKEGLDVVRTMLEATDGNRNAEFCPDVAFVLDPVPVKAPDIRPPLESNPDVPLVGFNINGLLYNGGYNRNNMFGLAMDYKSFVHRLAEEILSKTNAQLLLIPHTFTPLGHVESDPEAPQCVLESLAPRFPGRVHLVFREYDQSEIKSIIGMCDFFIGSRMHACIAALSQGVPAVAVAYSRKFKGVFDSVGVGEVVVDARTTSADAAIDKIMKTFDERVMVLSTLSKRVNEQREFLLDVFRGLTVSSRPSNE